MKTTHIGNQVACHVVLMFLLTIGVGCVVVRSYVTPFYQTALPAGAGKTFFVCPIDKGNMNNPEFFQYAGRVAQRLEAHGFKLAGTNHTERADLIVLLGYGINEGTSMVCSVPIYGQTGGGTTTYSGSFNANTMSFSSGNTYNTSGNFSGCSYSAPQYGVVGSDVETVRQYDRFLVLAIADWKTSTADRLNIIYTTRVKSSGQQSEIAMVMPQMIDSMFVYFPGESGKTYRITK